MEIELFALVASFAGLIAAVATLYQQRVALQSAREIAEISALEAKAHAVAQETEHAVSVVEVVPLDEIVRLQRIKAPGALIYSTRKHRPRPETKAAFRAHAAE